MYGWDLYNVITPLTVLVPFVIIVIFQNYQELNYTGFRKILKKHDKLLETTRGMEWRHDNIFKATFYKNKEVGFLYYEIIVVFDISATQESTVAFCVAPVNWFNESIWRLTNMTITQQSPKSR